MAANEREKTLVDPDDLLEYFYFENNSDSHTHIDSDSLSDDSESEEEVDREIVVSLIKNFVPQTEEETETVTPTGPTETLQLETVGGSGTEVNLKQLSSCKCKDICCLDYFTEQKVKSHKADCLSLEKEQLDLLLLGKLSCGLVHSISTATANRHPAKDREKHRTQYFFEGRTLCRGGFLYLNGIGKSRLLALTKHYKESGIVPRQLKYKGRNSAAITYEEATKVVTFLQNLATVHALALPGRVPGFKKTDVQVLPSDLTIDSIYTDYVSSCQASEFSPRSLRSFRRIWKAVLPMIIISKPSTDLCWTCQQHNYKYNLSVNHSEEEKEALIEEQHSHLRNAAAARKYMNKCIADSKGLLGGFTGLMEHVPLTGPESSHYCFDFAQQHAKLHYPYDPHQPGPIYFKTPRKCGLFGVCSPAMPMQVNYLIDEAVATSKGANAVVSLLHHFFEHYGHGEKDVILHADNCSGQNKNNTMLGYLAWRVATGRHRSVELNFLIAGHTKFSCDLHFGYLKKKTRRTKMSCLDDIKRAVEQSSSVNQAQLVGAQDGKVIVNMYNWAEFLSIKKLVGIKKYHQFRFRSSSIGVVEVKSFCDAEVGKTHALFSKAPEGMPSEIIPPGLDLKRQTYLAKEIREFCEPCHRDIVCPIPAVTEEEEELEEHRTKRLRR